MARPNYYLLLSLLALFTLDRLIKNLIILKLPAEGVLIFPGISIKLQLNPQLAFSLPAPNWLAIILSLAVLIIAVKILSKYLTGNRLANWGLGLLVIGSLSNLLDRFKYGGVVDWLNLWLPGLPALRWPSFNLSDVYIFTACLLLFLAFRTIGVAGGKEDNRL